MEVPILLLADYANVDAAGKLNILGAFNRIFFKKLPGKHQLMYLVMRIVAGLGEFDQERVLKVILFDEDGGTVWGTPEVSFIIKPPPGGGSGQFDPIIGIQDMEFKKPGRYEFRVFINGESKGFIPVDIVLMEPPSES